jgi:pSer/pThr/pTyr-binding forkhead associated (FHA) protein
MSFVISGNQVVLGREEGLDIVLQDPEASRRHARISWQGGRHLIEDLGSTNGTFVNGMQITMPQPLNPGDSVGIGQTARQCLERASPTAYQAPLAGVYPHRLASLTQDKYNGGCMVMAVCC